MIKDWFDSFRGNIYRRVTNPFLGTFVVVWLIYNWEAVFSLLYFDEDQAFSEKLAHMQTLVGEFSFSYLFELIGVTFLVLLLTYILLSISTIMASVYNKKVYPFLISKFDGDSVVMRDEYDRMQNRLEDMMRRNKQLKSDNMAMDENISSLTKQLVKAKEESSESSEIGTLDDLLEFEEEEKKEELKTKFKILGKGLKENSKVSEYLRFYNLAKTGVRIKSLADKKRISPYVDHGFFSVVELTNGGNIYEVTQEGEIFYKYIMGVLK